MWHFPVGYVALLGLGYILRRTTSRRLEMPTLPVPEPLIPGLPDDVAERILDMAIASSPTLVKTLMEVSRRWLLVGRSSAVFRRIEEQKRAKIMEEERCNSIKRRESLQWWQRQYTKMQFVFTFSFLPSLICISINLYALRQRTLQHPRVTERRRQIALGNLRRPYYYREKTSKFVDYKDGKWWIEQERVLCSTGRGTGLLLWSEDGEDHRCHVMKNLRLV